MNDMFSCDIGLPVKSLLDPLHGFLDFWKAWPRCDRKVGMPQAKAKWIKLECANNAMHIIMHVEYLKTTKQWQDPELIPLVCTYLNQQRWLDWEPPTAKPKPKDWLQEYAEHEKRAVPMPAHLRK